MKIWCKDNKLEEFERPEKLRPARLALVSKDCK